MRDFIQNAGIMMGVLAFATHAAVAAVDTKALEVSNDVEVNSKSDLNETRTSLNFKIGPGFSTLTLPEAGRKPYSSRTALSAAVELDLPISRSFSIVTGLNYAQKGLFFSDSDVFNGERSTYEGTFSLNYLIVPVLATIKIPIGSSTIAIGAGPYAGFAVAKSLQSTIVSGGTTTIGQEDLKDVSTFDFGLRAGLGLEMPVSRDLKFLVGGNYDLGLNSLSTDAKDPTIFTRTILASVGLGVAL